MSDVTPIKSKSLAGSLLPSDFTPDAEHEYDEALDGDAAEANVDANRVLMDHIAGLLEMVNVFTHTYEGTTITVCTVTLPNGFPLATEISMCNDPNDFKPEVGAAIAEKRARQKAENRLWDLEGYRMMTILGGGAMLPRSLED